jgi:hypothetical protein
MASMVSRFPSLGFVSSLALSLVFLLSTTLPFSNVSNAYGQEATDAPAPAVAEKPGAASVDPHDLPLPEKLPAATPKDETKKGLDPASRRRVWQVARWADVSRFVL